MLFIPHIYDEALKNSIKHLNTELSRFEGILHNFRDSLLGFSEDIIKFSQEELDYYFGQEISPSNYNYKNMSSYPKSLFLKECFFLSENKVGSDVLDDILHFLFEFTDVCEDKEEQGMFKELFGLINTKFMIGKPLIISSQPHKEIEEILPEDMKKIRLSCNYFLIFSVF